MPKEHIFCPPHSTCLPDINCSVPTRAPAVGCQAAYKTLTGKGLVNPLNHPWVEIWTGSNEGLLAVLRCPFSSANLPYDGASGS